VLDFDTDRQKALDSADKGDGKAADVDRAAVVAAFKACDYVSDVVFAAGFCYGGHLAFRAAHDKGTRATVCFYGTGIHSDRLGGGVVDSLARANEIEGELLLVWGRNDPHIPADGRAKIHRELDIASVHWESRLYAAEHAFIRDVGPRYDPGAADAALGEALALWSRRR